MYLSLAAMTLLSSWHIEPVTYSHIERDTHVHLLLAHLNYSASASVPTPMTKSCAPFSTCFLLPHRRCPWVLVAVGAQQQCVQQPRLVGGNSSNRDGRRVVGLQGL